MLKSKICLSFIEKTVEKYQEDGQMNYRLYHDSSSASSAFKSHEIAAIIYPSIMLLADAEAKNLDSAEAAISAIQLNSRAIRPYFL